MRQLSLRPARISFWRDEISFIVTSGYFWGSIWLLTRFLDITVVVVWLAIFQAVYLLRAALRSVILSPDAPVYARLGSFGWEMALTHRILGMTGFVIILLIQLTFPVICGFIYFSNEVPSDNNTRQIVQTVLMYMLSSAPMMVFLIVVAPLASKNVDNRLRLYLFVSQLIGLPLTVLTLSVALWSFGTPSSVAQDTMFGSSMLAFPPLLFSILIAYVACTSIVPFGFGWLRSTARRQYFADKQKRWLDMIVDVLRFPTPTVYASKLGELCVQLESEQARFISRHLAFYQVAEEQLNAQNYQAFRAAVDQSRQSDPRFVYRDYLEVAKEYIQQAAREISQTSDGARQTKIAADFAKAYKEKSQEIGIQTSGEGKIKPPVIALALFVLSSLVSAVLGKLGEEMVNMVFAASQ